MNAPNAIRSRLEYLDVHPPVAVSDAEYQRLLGYPRGGRAMSERAVELSRAARGWYTEHGRPWVYFREVELALGSPGSASPAADETLEIDGKAFRSGRLVRHLRAAGALRAMVVAVSAGRACEEEAGRRWEEAKPDEYYFLEMYGSAVVEALVAGVNARVCDVAADEGLVAIPHYSPGYDGWDVAEQNGLFECIRQGMTRPFPEPLRVLPSGMLVPKKSLLAVVGLAGRQPGSETPAPSGKKAAGAPPPRACENCSFSPCRYRRAPYRHAAEPPAKLRGNGVDGARRAYRVSLPALQKWARERVAIERRADGTFAARFRFDGTTCSNLGQPLAFDYALALGRKEEGFAILRADCRPSEGDDGFASMCAYLQDPEGTLAAIRGEHPPLGRRLEDAIDWAAGGAPSGCHCTAENRRHKWALALEAIHFAMTHAELS